MSMRNTIFGLAFALTTVRICALPPSASAQEISMGTWTGEIKLPHRPVEGMTFIVSAAGDSLSITMQSLLCQVTSCALTGIGIVGGTL